jgi:hypothetical protein
MTFACFQQFSNEDLGNLMTKLEKKQYCGLVFAYWSWPKEDCLYLVVQSKCGRNIDLIDKNGEYLRTLYSGNEFLIVKEKNLVCDTILRILVQGKLNLKSAEILHKLK